MQSELDESLESASEKLRIYTALDHRIRLRAVFLIADNPGISFNELKRLMRVRPGLLAYHLGLLKSEALISFTYERRGKSTSRYYISELGKSVLDELRSEVRKS